MSVIETVKTYLGVERQSDIRFVLHEDHEQILGLVRDMAEARTAPTRKAFFKILKPFLIAHARAEEQMVYVPLTMIRKSQEAKDLGNEGFVEHSLVDVLMARMSKPGVAGTDGWKAHAIVLKESLEHHIKEEEGQIYPELDKHFNDQERDAMAANFRSEKARLLRGKSPAKRL